MDARGRTAERVKENLTARDETAKQMKETYDKGRKEADYRKGDYVWLEKSKRKHALDARWLGPFEIAQVHNKLNVTLKGIPGGTQIGRKERRVNVDHIRRFEGTLADVLAQERAVESIEQWRQDLAGTPMFQVKFADGMKNWTAWDDLCDFIDDEWITNTALERFVETDETAKRALADAKRRYRESVGAIVEDSRT